MRCRSKTKSVSVVLRFTVGLIMGLFVLGISNARNVEGSHSHKGRFHKAKSLSCGDTITTHSELYNDLDCSAYTDTAALTLGEGASLNLNGKKVIGNTDIDCIDMTGDGAKVWNGTVMNCYYGIRVASNRNQITQVEVRDNERAGIYIEGGNSNKIYNSIVQNNGRQGINIDTGNGNEGGNSNKIYNSIVQNNGREGINITGSSSEGGESIEGGKSNTIYRSIAQNNGREGINIDTGEGNEISRTIVDNNGRQGIHIEGGKSNKISRTIVDNNGRHGIQIDEGNGSEISRSTVRGSCRDGIEINRGNDNSVFYNQVEDNGNPETCADFDEDYNPSAYAGIDVTDNSQNNEIKYNRAGCNLGCVATDDAGCIERERDLWDENVDDNGQFDSTNHWEHNSITCSNVAPELSGSPSQ